jgi:N-acetyl-alpha-D-muramate 1-phosphate uridylyltransferase
MPDPAFAMVLAAGLGTRMRPLTETTPKAMLKVAGRPLLDHAIDRCVEGGAKRVVVNVHHLSDQIETHLAQKTTPRIVVSFENTRLMDTGGGVRRALPLLGPAPFLVLNADAIWTGPAPARALADAWAAADVDALLLLVPRERAAAYDRPGDFDLDAQGRPARRTGETAAYVYTGAQMLRPETIGAFQDGEPFSMNRVWDALLRRGRLGAVVQEGGWVDVGTPAGLEAAEAALAAA